MAEGEPKFSPEDVGEIEDSEAINEVTHSQSDLYSAEKQKSPEEVEAEKAAMEKVIDLNHLSKFDRQIVFHTLGFRSQDRITAGILRTEQTLEHGIISFSKAKELGIQRSPYGHAPEDPGLGYTGPEAVALYPTTNIPGIGPRKETPYKGWDLICRLSKMIRRDDTEIFTRQVNPEQIVGVVAEEEVFDKKVADYLADNSPTVEQEKKDLTVAEYLKDIGYKYKIPIYKGSGSNFELFWPEKLSAERLIKYINDDEDELEYEE